MGWTEHGEWLSFTANVAWTTAYQIEARVASAVDGGRLRVYLNGAPLGADLNVPNTGVWQVWTTLAPANPVNLTAGRHLLKLLIVTGGFNIDLIRFTNNSLHSVSAASYAADGTAAPASITSLFGVNLADATVAADSVPLPVLLGDVSVTVTDSTGHSAGAPLFFVSPGQINYLVPDGSAPGEALVTVTRVGTVVAAGVIQIEAVAPGPFLRQRKWQGCGGRVGSHRDNWRRPELPITLSVQPNRGRLCAGAGGPRGGRRRCRVLYGTGIRGAGGTPGVTAPIGGVVSEVLYAAAQSEFAGLDQVNVRVPRSLAGRGEVPIVVTAGGKQTNAVTVSIH